MIKPANINNLIIRSPNWVGDVVMATPAFRCIRENFPNVKITIALKSYVQKLIDGAHGLIKYSFWIQSTSNRNGYILFLL